MTGPATMGWCPGALRPMASGDGMILRVKPRGGVLTLDQAVTVAGLSRRFGNGHLDLTSRANIQLRGARDETVAPILHGLRDAGLLDGDVETEARRNVVASPLAGIDPACFDIRPFLAALEDGLAQEQALRFLPAKWSFVVDGGGQLPLAGVSADVRFVFDAAGRLCIDCAGHISQPVSDRLDLPRFLARLAALIGRAPDRMAGIVDRFGAAYTLAALDLALGSAVPATATRRCDPFAAFDRVVAFAPPFGDLPAETLDAVAAACRATGGTGLRLTPWRVVFATGLADAAAFRKTLAALGLIVERDDPRRGVTACVGAPACHRASVPTRVDAAMLAARLGRDLDATIHISGCAKRCGHPRDVGWSLVARTGLYDLAAGSELTPLVTGLSSTAAANWLSRAGRARTS